MFEHFLIIKKKYEKHKVIQKNRANICQKIDKQTFLYYTVV